MSDETKQDATPEGSEPDGPETEEDVWGEIAAAENGDSPDDAPAQDGEDTPEGGGGEEEATGDDTAGDSPPSPPDADDMWADAPASLRSAFDAEKRRADAAEHGKRSSEGRIAALTKRLEAVMAGTQRPANRQPQTETSSAAIDQAMQTLETDFPEIAGPVKAVVQAAIAPLIEQNRRLEAGLQTVGEERLNARAQSAEARVIEAHPDYGDIADSDKLVEWVMSKPVHIRAAVQANAERIEDPDVVIDVLSQFKRETGQGDGANGANNGASRKSTADRVTRLRRNSNTGLPRPSPGATPAEASRRNAETEEDVWAEIRRNEAKRVSGTA